MGVQYATVSRDQHGARFPDVDVWVGLLPRVEIGLIRIVRLVAANRGSQSNPKSHVSSSGPNSCGFFLLNRLSNETFGTFVWFAPTFTRRDGRAPTLVTELGIVLGELVRSRVDDMSLEVDLSHIVPVVVLVPILDFSHFLLWGFCPPPQKGLFQSLLVPC